MNEFKLVPMEPTQEMIDAARDQHEGEPYLPVSLYKAMLSASPDVQGEPVAYRVTGSYTDVPFKDESSAKAYCRGLLSGDPEGGYRITPLYAAPQPAPAVQGEPVAVINGSHCFSLDDANRLMRLPTGTKLYTAPQPAPDVSALAEALEPFALAWADGEALRDAGGYAPVTCHAEHYRRAAKALEKYEAHLKMGGEA